MAARNTTITAVPGIRVGHWTDPDALTGCTVIVCDVPMVCGVDVRGSATGTREIEICRMPHVSDHVQAVVLSGGSAFGLDAATGVHRALARDGRGFPVGRFVVPHVPAAILFDLSIGDGAVRPNAAAGEAAYADAGAKPVRRGNVGAGTGATIGKLRGPDYMMKGGIGSAAVVAGGCTVGALVALNAVGDVRDPRSGKLLAGLRRAAGRGLADSAKVLREQGPPAAAPGENTVLGCVATDATLSKEEAIQFARAGTTGVTQCLSPPHLPMDGDLVFGLGRRDAGRRLALSQLMALATEATIRAILDAVRQARPVAGVPAYQRR